MSPILVRPVREQLEHDRVIRLLQAKYKRKFEVGINPGSEQSAPVGSAPDLWYPDLVLQSAERGHKILGVVEVETVESINHLEAMAEWRAFGRLKAPFYLYVPAAMVDVARRFCLDLQISVTEIWAFHALGDQIRFTLVQRAPGADNGNSLSAPREATRRPTVAAAAASRTGRSRAAKPVAAKSARRPSPSARKKVTRSAKAAKTVSRPARKPVARAAKRK